MLNVLNFVPKKSICKEMYCITFFKKKKKRSAAKAHRILVETYYDDHALMEQNTDVGFDDLKIMIFNLKIKNALAHRR